MPRPSATAVPVPPTGRAHPDLQRRAAMARLGALWAAAAVPLSACGGGSSSPPAPAPVPVPSPPPSAGGGTPAPTPPAPAPASNTPARLTLISSALQDPWGFVFLPDGRMLVTQRGGSLVIVSADGRTISDPLAGLPGTGTLSTSGQGGLLDVALDPDFDSAGQNWVYFTYSEQLNGVRGTAVNRGRLDLANRQLTDVSMTPLFRQTKDGGTNHYGSRLAFGLDKTLFVTLGDKQAFGPAQDLTGTLGKVVRLQRDGSIPSGNPDLGAGAHPAIWSYGHRNPQGAAVHPGTGELWITEHGPQGGDELNRILPGRNYGWPLRSYGCDYGATNADCMIGGGTHAPTYTEPATWWPGPGNTPPYSSIAPSGLMFYSGSGFPEWQGNLFFGALAGTALWRIVLNGNTVVERERLFASASQRVRCVRQGPDGWLYFIATNGGLYRVDRS